MSRNNEKHNDNANYLEIEGVIKYRNEHDFSKFVAQRSVEHIEIWRQLCVKTGLLGQDPTRYAGYAFGNISMRTESGFVISGTQTSGKAIMRAEGYACVVSADVKRNVVESFGKIKPSSESLTHAQIYQLLPNVKAVIHAHVPSIWYHAINLGLPTTPRHIEYGTPEMAQAVETLISNSDNASGCFAMLGHLDGVVTYAEDCETAFNQMIHWYVAATISEGSEQDFC